MKNPRVSYKMGDNSTVNFENFARTLLLRISLKDMFGTFKNRDKGMIYVYQ